MLGRLKLGFAMHLVDFFIRSKESIIDYGKLFTSIITSCIKQNAGKDVNTNKTR